jgi:hypothetical protein
VSDQAAAPPSVATELEVLRSFGIASPALVEARSLQQRFDRKYLIAAHDIAGVLAHLQPSHCVLRAGDQIWARYRSVYFDTPDRELYHAHRRDRRPRFKVRLRHHDDRRLSFLEVKRKDNTGRTAKYRLALPFGHDDLGARERTFIDAHAPLAGQCLLPRVALSFQRLTLVGRALDERVTFDKGLTVAAGTSVAELGRVVIAEVKQAHFVNHTGAVDGFRREHVREMALSKYCLATALVAPVPANVFKPALRAIERLSV